jgi:hypothetical protein
MKSPDVSTPSIKPMKTARLQAILAAADQGQATINEAVEIAGAALASTSRNSAEIKQMLQGILTRLNVMQEQIDFLYQHNSPIYAAVLQDDEEEENDEEEASKSGLDESDSDEED